MNDLIPESLPEDSNIDWTLLDAYTDENAAKAATFATEGYYREKWSPVLEKKSKWAGYNGAVLLVGWLWFLYRKMYKAAILLLLATLIGPLIGGIIIGIFADPRNVTDGLIMTVAISILVAIRIYVSCIANGLYLKRAIRFVQESKNIPGGESEKVSWLRKKGGLSGIALTIGIIINVVTNVLDRILLT